MDYQTSQNLVNDLLGDGSNFDLRKLNSDLVHADVVGASDDLNAYGRVACY